MKSQIFARLSAFGAAAVLSLNTAFASPAAALLRTEYERQQQNLPLLQRDKLIAEPGLLAIAIILAIYMFFKLRRDVKNRLAEDEEYRRRIAEAERLEAAEDAARAAQESEAFVPEVEAEIVGVDDLADDHTVVDAVIVEEESPKA